MGSSRRLAAVGLLALCLYLLAALGLRGWQGQDLPEHVEAGRMKNVTVTEEGLQAVSAPALPAETESPGETPAPVQTTQPPETPAAEPLTRIMESVTDEEILETTIQGGLSIKNETDYQVDAAALLAAGPQVRLPAGEAQILIIHTHGSEAYTQAGLDHYESDDNNRTTDKEYNIVRVGDELTELFTQAGLQVIHDREIYDYPSYTGSYTRSGAAIESYLQEYPSIAMVIDLHRDALGANGVVYKTMAEEEGVCASQVMILVGSDSSGLEHPNWQSNLSLALYLQNAVSSRHPTLMRPVSLVRERYNQHLTLGSMIIEVGSSGNTLQEALAAIRLFAEAAAPALLELVGES